MPQAKANDDLSHVIDLLDTTGEESNSLEEESVDTDRTTKPSEERDQAEITTESGSGSASSQGPTQTNKKRDRAVSPATQGGGLVVKSLSSPYRPGARMDEELTRVLVRVRPAIELCHHRKIVRQWEKLREAYEVSVRHPGGR